MPSSEMSKRELEKRIREDQEATAYAFQEFIQTFQANSATHCKTFVKSGLLHPNKGQEEVYDKGQLYAPKPLILKQDTSTIKSAIECARLVKDVKLERRNQIKQKSNLEILKEELKLRHATRDEKAKAVKEETANYYDNTDNNNGGDPNSTNLFIANLSQKVTENDLMLLFGAYGPLASVKIMWPRGDEKMNRSTNCGFVAYMSRKDAERALNELKHRDDMRVGWGKSVELPSHPVYIPPELIKYHLPPPLTGLPFNAQPIKPSFKAPTDEEEMNSLLSNSVVKVTIPLNKRVLMVVNRMVEFVAREGPLFEAMVMNRELQNPVYRFLFDNKSPVHTYYRWKLYSILHGEGQKSWSAKRFRMFKGGSVWIPPTVRDYSEGMPDNLIQTTNHKADKALLSDSQINRLINYLQNMNSTRASIVEVMIFCLNHKDAMNDIMSLISDAFRNVNTKATKKVARLYLVNDILYNYGLKNATNKMEANNFQREMKKYVIDIFENLRKTLDAINKSGDKEQFKFRIENVLKSWSMWKIFENGFLNELANICLSQSRKPPNNNENEDDVFSDEPLDGASLLKRKCNNNPECVINDNKENSIPRTRNKKIDFSGFVPSKWEAVDPDEVEAQAMSTQKFYDMERKRKQEEERHSKNNIDERERKRLRKIEVMVMEYRDDIESGKRKIRRGMNIEAELNEYRNKLLDKMKKDCCQERNLSPVSSDSSSEQDKDTRCSRKLKQRDKRKIKDGSDTHRRHNRK